MTYTIELCTYRWWEEPELVGWKKFDLTGRDKIVPNYQADNQQYWDNIVAEIEDRIVRKEDGMDKEPSWRESPSEVSAGSYHKKFELAGGYLKKCEACGLEDHHVYYRYYQCDQLVP